MQTPEEKNPQKPNKIKTDKACNKRFSDEQIKSLESIFKVEDKLEQKKKLQIAKDLGLQPRQVAIWFQNRRARWKSKQIEQDYRVLKENYDKLSMDFGDMKREKQSLQMELRELKEKFKNMQKVVSSSDTDGELKENFESSNEEIDHNRSMSVDDVENIVKSFVKTEDDDVRSWDERDDEINQLASLQTWRDLSTAGLFENSSDIPDWWE